MVLRDNDATFLCPDTTSLMLKGGNYSEEFAYVYIRLKGCDNETSGVECLDKN